MTPGTIPVVRLSPKRLQLSIRSVSQTKRTARENRAGSAKARLTSAGVAPGEGWACRGWGVGIRVQFAIYPRSSPAPRRVAPHATRKSRLRRQLARPPLRYIAEPVFRSAVAAELRALRYLDAQRGEADGQAGLSCQTKRNARPALATALRARRDAAVQGGRAPLVARHGRRHGRIFGV